MEPLIRTTSDADHVATIWMDAPGKSVNTCSQQFLVELAEALESIDRDQPTGLIFASAKPRSFNAGVDLFEVSRMTREQISALLGLGQQLFDQITRLAVPTVAAINGDCLGGGFELALACRYRVAADNASISIGLPEIKLGLIPGWGGTTRLPRMIGLRRALPILLAGGGFRHGQHLHFDPQNPPPLCNLYVSMLQRLGIEVSRFSSSTGTLTGLEQVG